jgi:hypothetical protein
MSVNRPKDQPHIAILRRFLDEEVVAALAQETEPRARLGAAERLLDVLGRRTLDEALAKRLVPLATTPADFKFLAHRAPARFMRELMDRAPSDDVRWAVQRIAQSRDRSL